MGTRSLKISTAAAFFALTLLFSAPLGADILLTLNESALSEAVKLGTGPIERVREFLRPYRQALTEMDRLPYASEVEVFTPFRRMVENALIHAESYSFSDTRHDYNPKNDRLTVEVTIRLPMGYVYDRATPLGADWVIRAHQQGKPLKLVDRSSNGLFALGTGNSGGTMIGAQVRMNYDIREADLKAPVTLEIISPDGRRQEVTLPLAALR